MDKNENITWTHLENIIGLSVKSFKRVFTVIQGKIEDDEGPLQITFKNDQILFLTWSSNGASLKTVSTQWNDPLSGELDASTQKWIDQNGKEELIDLSGIEPYSKLIGKNVHAVNPIYHPYGSLCGVQIQIDEAYLNFFVLWDECFVQWGEKNGNLLDKGFTQS